MKKKPEKKRSRRLSISDSDIFRKDSEVLSRANADGEVSIISLSDMKSYYRIDAWAAVVWNLLDGKTDVSRLDAKIQKASGIEAKVVRKENRKLLTQLLRNGLLERVK